MDYSRPDVRVKRGNGTTVPVKESLQVRSRSALTMMGLAAILLLGLSVTF